MLCSSVVLVQSAVLLLPKVGIGVETREAERRAWARKVALNSQGNSTPGSTRTPHQATLSLASSCLQFELHFKRKHNTTIMSRSTDPGHFFQSDASEAIRARRAAKSGNTFGNPIKLQSKILAVVADPASSASVYVAESAGCIRRVNLNVSRLYYYF